MPRVVPSQVVTLIDQLFPWANNLGSGRKLDFHYSGQLASILELVDQIPPELIVLDPDNYTKFVLSVSVIRTAINTTWWRGSGYKLGGVPGLGGAHPVVLIRQCLSVCPDEFPAPSTVELTFIVDNELRENLCIDISTAHQALANGEWKAATVLAGATVEALLVWALQKRKLEDIEASVTALMSSGALTPYPGSDLEKWTLHPLIRVAEQLNIIEAETATEAKLAQNFRNLIDANRAKRLGQKCDRGTALSALAAVEHVVRDLTR